MLPFDGNPETPNALLVVLVDELEVELAHGRHKNTASHMLRHIPESELSGVRWWRWIDEGTHCRPDLLDDPNMVTRHEVCLDTHLPFQEIIA